MASIYDRKRPVSEFFQCFNEMADEVNALGSQMRNTYSIIQFLKEHIAPRLSERPVVFEDVEAMVKADFLTEGDVCIVFVRGDNPYNYVQLYQVQLKSAAEGIALRNPSLCAVSLSPKNADSVPLAQFQQQMAGKVNVPQNKGKAGDYLIQTESGTQWNTLPIVDNLFTGGVKNILSAEQGKLLKELLDSYAKEQSRLLAQQAKEQKAYTEQKFQQLVDERDYQLEPLSALTYDALFQKKTDLYRQLNAYFGTHFTSAIQNMDDLVNSKLAMTVLVWNEDLVRAVFGSPFAWDKVTASGIAMERISANMLVMNRLSSNQALLEKLSSRTVAIEKVVASEIAMKELVGSAIAVDEMAKKTAFLDKVLTSPVAMECLAASEIGVEKIIANSALVDKVLDSATAIVKIVASATAMTSLAKLTKFIDKAVEDTYLMEKLAASGVVMEQISLNTSFVNKILGSTLALNCVAASGVAVEKLLHNDTFVDQVLRADAVVEKMVASGAAMEKIAVNINLMSKMDSASPLFKKAIASDIAMEKLAASGIAMRRIADNSSMMYEIVKSAAVMEKLAASEVAMDCIANSSNALRYVLPISWAMEKIAASEAARKKMFTVTLARDQFMDNKNAMEKMLGNPEGAKELLLNTEMLKVLVTKITSSAVPAVRQALDQFVSMGKMKIVREFKKEDTSSQLNVTEANWITIGALGAWSESGKTQMISCGRTFTGEIKGLKSIPNSDGLKGKENCLGYGECRFSSVSGDDYAITICYAPV